MEKALLWSAYVLASLAIFFSDDIKRWLKARMQPAPAPAIPAVPDATETALATLATEIPGPADHAMELLARKPDTWVTARLIELLSARNALVARRAAMVLVQRKDPAAMQALFKYFAK